MSTLDLCEEIARRMRNLQEVRGVVEHSIQNENFSTPVWNCNTFVDGYTGIACFYAFLDYLIPERGWRGVAHEYLQEAVQSFESQGLEHYSLFSGLAGFCFAVFLCSQEGNYYRNIQNKLDTLLIERIEKELAQLRFSDQILPQDYNLMSGMSGVLAYVLQRQNELRFRRLATDIANWMVELLDREKENGLPIWYISPDQFLAKEEKSKYPEGVYWLNMPAGIIGCLSVLALALKEQIPVEKLAKIVQKIAYWLKDQQCTSDYGPLFPNTLDAGTSPKISPFEINRDSWWSGIPSVARSIYLAAKALRDGSLAQYAEKLFLSLFAKPMKEWNLMGTSVAHGRAGLLAITFRMAQETQNPLLWKEVDRLEQDLKSFYRPQTPFCFQMVHINERHEYLWVDHPGLWMGAAGIALSLLLVQRQKDFPWDRSLLVV